MILLNEFREDFESLSDEKAGKLIKMVFGYVNGNPVDEQDPVLMATFRPIRRSMDNPRMASNGSIKCEIFESRKDGK